MSDDNGWKWQWSEKLDQAMLNIRAQSAGELAVMLKDELPTLAEAIKEAHRLFEPAASRPVPAPSFPIADVRATPPPVASQAAPAASGELEIGPLTLMKVDESDGVSGPASKNPGKPYKRFIVSIGTIKASTFDTLIGQAAKNLIGKPVYFTAAKGNFGYDLKSLRTA